MKTIEKSIITFIIGSVIIALLTGCQRLGFRKKPDILQVRNIVNMATLECYYHNVAKSIKSKGTGISGIGETDKKFWIEYTGIVTLGIDMSKVDMDIDGNNITITLPPATVLGVTINDQSWNKDSIITSGDSINPNKINAEDILSAIDEAQATMQKTAEGNKTMLNNAQIRAKVLIENYINQLGEITGTEYVITWKYLNPSE